MSKAQKPKRIYATPSLKSYAADELIAAIGPAVAIYGPAQP